nr:DNA alkylation repair protein [Actinokineospora inagensis]
MAAVVRAALASAGDPERAPEMQRYMKSDMPFRGVPKPARAALVRGLPALETRSEWLDVTGRLWWEAKYREERYVALDLLGLKKHAGWRGVGLLPTYSSYVVSGAWWDFVDEIANRHIGPLLLADADFMTPQIRTWAADPDLWKRRVSVICQLGAKAETDLELLTYAIEANAEDKDFFLRKAIGWALRQYARVEPGWVKSFVDNHPTLSPLSRREALKHL